MKVRLYGPALSELNIFFDAKRLATRLDGKEMDLTEALVAFSSVIPRESGEVRENGRCLLLKAEYGSSLIMKYEEVC